MTADEIRKHWNVVGGPGQYPPELISDFALVEIAAQLAELNENLRSVIGGPGKIRRVQVDARTYDQNVI